jgi:hypothetical protein
MKTEFGLGYVLTPLVFVFSLKSLSLSYSNSVSLRSPCHPDQAAHVKRDFSERQLFDTIFEAAKAFLRRIQAESR